MSKQNPSQAPSSLRAQKQEFTRTRLIEAAIETFASKTYTSSTIDDIAAAAGCSRATFYLHYSGKAEVMLAFLQRRWPAVVAGYRDLDAMLARGMTRSELRSWLATWMASWAEQRDLQAAITSAEISEPEIREWVTSSRLELIDALETFFSNVAPAEREERRARAVALEAMSRAAFQLSTSHRLSVSDDQVLDYLTELWADQFLA